MSIFNAFRRMAVAVVVGLPITALAMEPVDPPLDTDLNNFPPTKAIGRYIQQVSSNVVEDVVVLTNGVLTVGTESINIPPGATATNLPVIAGTAFAGTSKQYARADHVHPAETSLTPGSYVLPASAFQIYWFDQVEYRVNQDGTWSLAGPIEDEGAGAVVSFNESGDYVNMTVAIPGHGSHQIATFSASTLAFASTSLGELTFGSEYTEPRVGEFPVLERSSPSVSVRGVPMATSNDMASATNDVLNAATAALGDLATVKVSGEQCATNGIWCVNDGILGADIIFTTGFFSEPAIPTASLLTGSYITFNPIYFGMGQFETIQQFTIQGASGRESAGANSANNFMGYARLLNTNDLTTVLAVSDRFSITNYDQVVSITLRPHVLLDTNNTYTIQFVAALSDSEPVQDVPIGIVTTSVSPYCYVNGDINSKPCMTVKHFLSMSGLMQCFLTALRDGDYTTIQGMADTMATMGAFSSSSAAQISPSSATSANNAESPNPAALGQGAGSELFGN